jgi:hypothetical protein
VYCARGVPVRLVGKVYQHVGSLPCGASALRLMSAEHQVDMEKLAWESHIGEQCPFCRTHKRRFDVFCFHCWKAVPQHLRGDLLKPFKDGRRLVAFVKAMAALKKNKESSS